MHICETCDDFFLSHGFISMWRLGLKSLGLKLVHTLRPLPSIVCPFVHLTLCLHRAICFSRHVSIFVIWWISSFSMQSVLRFSLAIVLIFPPPKIFPLLLSSQRSEWENPSSHEKKRDFSALICHLFWHGKPLSLLSPLDSFLTNDIGKYFFGLGILLLHERFSATFEVKFDIFGINILGPRSSNLGG